MVARKGKRHHGDIGRNIAEFEEAHLPPRFLHVEVPQEVVIDGLVLLASNPIFRRSHGFELVRRERVELGVTTTALVPFLARNGTCRTSKTARLVEIKTPLSHFLFLFVYRLTRQLQADFTKCTASRKPARLVVLKMQERIARPDVSISRQGIDRAAHVHGNLMGIRGAALFVEPSRVSFVCTGLVPRTFTDGYDARNLATGDLCRNAHAACIVVDVDQIAGLNSSGLGILGIVQRLQG